MLLKEALIIKRNNKHYRREVMEGEYPLYAVARMEGNNCMDHVISYKEYKVRLGRIDRAIRRRIGVPVIRVSS